jgi:hypothetical protein
MKNVCKILQLKTPAWPALLIQEIRAKCNNRKREFFETMIILLKNRTGASDCP